MYLLETRSKWPVSGLASELEMPRQTMNSILKSLVAKGLALETKQKGINYFNSNTAQLFARVEALHDTHKSAVRTISEFIDG